jgi:hypothetical protein
VLILLFITQIVEYEQLADVTALYGRSKNACYLLHLFVSLSSQGSCRD